MKQINPLYIALLLIVVMLIVTFKLNDANTAHDHAISALNQTEMMAKQTAALKKSWDDKSSFKKLEALLNSSVLRNVEFGKETKQSILTLTAKSIDRKSAEYLLNKLFNSPYTVRGLDIKRIDEQTASIRIEVTQ